MGRRAAALWLIAALSVCSAALAGTASAASVESGPLSATAGERRFSLELEGRRGRPVLSALRDRATDLVGTLGFRDGSGAWRPATRVLSSSSGRRTLRLRLATADPARRFDLRLSPAGRGVIRMRAKLLGPGVEGIGVAFRARPGERFLGFGERSNAVDQRGRTVESWAGEGPYQPIENPVIKGFVPEWSLRTTEDATYYPMPWLLSTAGYGVLAEETAPTYFRLGTERPDAWSVEVVRRPPGVPRVPDDAPSPRGLTLSFFYGPRPAGALRRMTAATGRQPEPAPWFFGPWVQPPGPDAETIGALRGADVPTSAGQTYVHYLPCGHQIGEEAQQLERTSLYHANGMAVTTYFNPMICTGYQPLFDRLGASGQLTRDRTGAPYEYSYLSYRVGEFDFSSAAAGSSYGQLLREALGHGYDGWMEDFGEYHPPDGVSADGAAGVVAHNRYPREYHCAAYEQTRDHPRPVLRFVRSGYTGSAACSPVVWGGDPSTGWDFDGLRSSVQNGLTMGLSGVGIWGSDIGGFFSLLSDPLSPELLARWLQFGAFSGVMRTQADGLQVDDRYRPQVLDPDLLPIWRRYAKLRTQLYPYVRGAVSEYRRTGMPLMRSHALTDPGDRRATGLEDQYMFGDDLLVAPVLEHGALERSVYLPRGGWIDLWRSFGYRESDGALEPGRAKVLSGRRWVTVPAPREQIPVMVRAGALLATLPPEVDTLAPYGQGDPDLVRLADRDGVRGLLAFPRGRSAGAFERRGRLVSRESERGWRLRIEDTRARRWSLQASFAALRRPFRPRCVTVDGRPLERPAWSYSGSRKLLRATFRARSGTAVVSVTRRGCRR